MASRSAERTQTVQAAFGAVPVIYGGPLNVGGAIIYAKEFGSGQGKVLIVDFSVSEGLIQGMTTLRWSKKTAGEIGIGAVTFEVHLGTPGDVTSVLINARDAAYRIPDGIAHVAVRYRAPTSADLSFNPFDFTLDASGRIIYDFRRAQWLFSKNPVLIAYDMLTNSVFSIGNSASAFVMTDWTAAANVCDENAGDGRARWEFNGRLDRRDSLEASLRYVLAHCGGHLRYNAGKIGIWLDGVKAPVAGGISTTRLVFCDNDDNSQIPQNLVEEVTWSSRGREQVPTVVTVDFTNHDDGDVDDSTQFPLPAVLSPTSDWIEQHFSLPGHPRRGMADQMAERLWKIAQRDRDIRLVCWRNGIVPLTGDRIGVDSRRLIPKTTISPNTGSVAGVEDVIVLDQQVASETVTLRCMLYRDADFALPVPPAPPPTPPPPKTIVFGTEPAALVSTYVLDIPELTVSTGAIPQPGNFLIAGQGVAGSFGTVLSDERLFPTDGGRDDDFRIGYVGSPKTLVGDGVATFTITGFAMEDGNPPAASLIFTFILNNPTVFKFEDGSSSPANRFFLPGLVDLSRPKNTSITFQYNSRWFPLAYTG